MEPLDGHRPLRSRPRVSRRRARLPQDQCVQTRRRLHRLARPWFAKAAAKGGWDVPKWPKEFGGPGWTPTQHYIWEQETATAMMPFDMPFGVGMLAPILMGYGSKEQQERFLPDIRSRKVNWCQGYSEPGAGSDLASLKTKAELSADGKTYTVNGTKIWTTAAHIADWIFCLTRTVRHRQAPGRHHVPAVPDEATGRRSETDHHARRQPHRQHGAHHRRQSAGRKSHRRRRPRLDVRERSAAARAHRTRRHFAFARCAGKTEGTGAQRQTRQRFVDGRTGVPREGRRARSRSAGARVHRIAQPRGGIRRRRARTRVVDHEIERHRDSAAHRKTHRRSGRHLLGRLGSSGRTRSSRATAWRAISSSRAYTIYGGASEVQKDVIAKNVLGIKSGKK